MKKIIEQSMKKYFQLRKYRIDMWKMSAKNSQESILFELLKSAQNTVFGKKHSFASIISVDDFQSQVPILQYEDLYPYIHRMIEGEIDVLWPGCVNKFSQSSGTTNDRSKYIPVSHDALYNNNYKAGRDVYSIFFDNYPESDLYLNKGCAFGLAGSCKTNEQGVTVGDVSAILISELPKWLEEYREPSLDVALMSQWEDKIPAMIEDVVGKNITHLSGVPTWFINLFEKMKEKHPYETLRDIWPNLELFIHGAVAFGPYRPLFEKLLPFSDMKYMEVYNASEGFFAIQDDPKKHGEMLLLTDHGVFYEFIPMDNYTKDTQQAITLPHVQLGIDYAIIITTNAGLWRYDLGDTVCFSSIDPYRIKITGRTKHFINVFGEELMIGNTDQALTEIAQETGITIEQYTAGPIFMNEQGKGGHEWIIEFKKSPQSVSDFSNLLDSKLQDLNSDYAAKRQNNIALQKPLVHSVPAGTFIAWMKKRGRLGSQTKVPRLSNVRKYLEEILEQIVK